MSDQPFTYFENVIHAIDAIPTESIVSRTFVREGGTKAILFAFDTGQELSEHTASVPAILHFLEGEADLTLGGVSKPAHAGTWVYMQPKLSHSIVAKTPLKMLLIMLPGESE
jgi:quercetin dioxygenase-like cupin family protein